MISGWLLVLALVCGCTAPARSTISPSPGETGVAPQPGEPLAVEPAAAWTATAFPSATPTATASPIATAEPWRTSTATASLQPTATPSPTATPTPTPGPTPDGVARTLQVPILMYHYVSVPPADADVYRRDLSVSPALFEEHLATWPTPAITRSPWMTCSTPWRRAASCRRSRSS